MSDLHLSSRMLAGSLADYTASAILRTPSDRESTYFSSWHWDEVIRPVGWAGPPKPKDDEHNCESVVSAGHKLLMVGAKRPLDTVRAPTTRFRTATKIQADGYELKDYQKQAVSTLENDYRGHGAGKLLGFGPGTGKTIISLSFVLQLPRMPTRPHLFVVPAGLLHNWIAEARMCLDPVPNICVYYEDQKAGTRASYTPRELQGYDIVITTYNKVVDEYKTFSRLHNHFVSRQHSKEYHLSPSRGRTSLMTMDWHVVVADEAHRMADHKSLTSLGMRQLECRYRLPMTGTPFCNEYTDIQSLMAFLRLQPWADQDEFVRAFLVKSSKETSYQLLSANTNAIFAIMTHAVTLRLSNTDYFDGRPIADFRQGIEQVIGHTLTERESVHQLKTKTLWDAKTRAEYRKSKRIGAMTRKTVFKDITNARLAAIHPLLKRFRYGDEDEGNGDVFETPLDGAEDAADENEDSASRESSFRKALKAATKKAWRSSRMVAFINCLRQHIRDHPGKVIVFSQYRNVLDVAQNALEDFFGDTIRICRYDGSVDGKERKTRVDAFMNTEKYNLFLGTTGAGGEGLTLTVANAVIHLNEGWNPQSTIQGNARAIRIGTSHQVYVYYMYAHDSIERHVRLRHKEKLRKASKILDPDPEMQALMGRAGRLNEMEYASQMRDAKLETSAHTKDVQKHLLDRQGFDDDLLIEDLVAETELAKDVTALVVEAGDVLIYEDALDEYGGSVLVPSSGWTG